VHHVIIFLVFEAKFRSQSSRYYLEQWSQSIKVIIIARIFLFFPLGFLKNISTEHNHKVNAFLNELNHMDTQIVSFITIDELILESTLSLSSLVYHQHPSQSVTVANSGFCDEGQSEGRFASFHTPFLAFHRCPSSC